MIASSVRSLFGGLLALIGAQWCGLPGPEAVEPASRFTFVLSGETVLQTTYSFLSNAAVSEGCHFVSLILDDLSGSGSLVNSSQVDRAANPVGTVNWTVGPDGGPSPQCSNSFRAEFEIARKTYVLEGEVLRVIQPWNSEQGALNASGTWVRSDSIRSGAFEFFDYRTSLDR